MPQARAVGRVKPRSAAEDWFAVGFDPWSAGREPLSAEFIPSLSIKQVDYQLSYFQYGKYVLRIIHVCSMLLLNIASILRCIICAVISMIPQFDLLVGSSRADMNQTRFEFVA